MNFNTLENRDYIYLLGSKIEVKLVKGNVRRSTIDFSDNCLRVNVPEDKTINDAATLVRQKMITWYKEFALDHLMNRVAYFEALLKVKPKLVRVRSYKSRWGSCRENGVITFNWKIIQAPEKIVDYVVIHELCHLKIMNHSKDYWDYVALFYPDFQSAKKWLKDNVLRLQEN